jgi:hypothetical protein
VPSNAEGLLINAHQVAAARASLEEAIEPAALQQSCNDPLDKLRHDVADDDDRKETDEPGKPDEELVPGTINAVGDVR